MTENNTIAPTVPRLHNVITYSSNNSGGIWWLSDDDWQALAAAGWVVHWRHDLAIPHGDIVHEPSRFPSMDKDHTHGYDHELVPVEPTGQRWLGALATSAAKETTDPAATIAEWERITGDANAEGCNCCGSLHSFTFYDKDGNRQHSYVEVVRTELRWS